jgi:hypothetical protein
VPPPAWQPGRRIAWSELQAQPRQHFQDLALPPPALPGPGLATTSTFRTWPCHHQHFQDLALPPPALTSPLAAVQEAAARDLSYQQAMADMQAEVAEAGNNRALAGLLRERYVADLLARLKESEWKVATARRREATWGFKYMVPLGRWGAGQLGLGLRGPLRCLRRCVQLEHLEAERLGTA